MASAAEAQSPFRSIPNEILQIIFDYCCDVNYFRVLSPQKRLPSGSSSSLQKFPLVLSSVCSRWRSNALAIPKIWSQLKLEWLWLPTVEDPECEELFFPLVNFLNRSLQNLLAIHLVIDTIFFSANRWFTHPIFARLTGCSDRWQSFTYKSDTFYIDDLFRGNSSCQWFPRLIEVVFLDDSPSTSDVSVVFANAPNLKRALLGHTLDDPISAIEHFPYPHLSHLEFYPLLDEDLVTLPNQMVNLVSLTVAESYYYSKLHLPLSDLTSCPRIRNIIIHQKHDMEPSYSVYPFFTFPSLESLSFVLKPSTDSGSCTKIWPNFDRFMELVERSHFPLTALSMTSLPLSDSNLMLLLTHIPTLLNLTISDSDIPYRFSPITSRLVKSLHASYRSPYGPEPTPLVPKLHSLKLDTHADDGFDDASVAEMVKSRWIPSTRSFSEPKAAASRLACLRQFTMIFRNRDRVDGVYDPLEEIERDGLRAVVLWRGNRQ